MGFAALLWDVDGTLVETERDGHRRAFNRAFRQAGLSVHWDVDRYGELLAIAGGVERIGAYLAGHEGQPPDPRRVAELHASKQCHYAALVAEGGLALRPGVRRLIEAAAAAGLRQAIVTTSGREAVDALAQHLFADLLGAFDVWICGGDVAHKKPNSEAYRRSLELLQLDPSQACAIEDSSAGLRAALGAGLPCLVTLSHYSAQEPGERFAGAGAVVDQLGDGVEILQGPPCQDGRITLSYLESLR
jgi:HAD superfamily hydrolase (TIGR01509 family)